MLIDAQTHDLGDGFIVRRLLPQATLRTVGPFVFFDEMGPHQFAPGSGLDVRPHPHIGLATLTYLFDGAIAHRDSLGTVLDILPGAVNVMVAGRGIVHSERSPAIPRAAGHRLHGLQTWLALPEDQVECAPAFAHTAADQLPIIDLGDGSSLRVVAGAYAAQTSPVLMPSPTTYWHVQLAPHTTHSLMLPGDQALALYVVSGPLQADGIDVATHQALLLDGASIRLSSADKACSAVIFGGSALQQRRRLWWNFVALDGARLEQAKADWREGRFASVPGETEFIPLPETG